MISEDQNKSLCSLISTAQKSAIRLEKKPKVPTKNKFT